MSDTQNYKVVTFTKDELFSVELGLENRISQIKNTLDRLEKSGDAGGNLSYYRDQLAAAETALAKVIAE